MLDVVKEYRRRKIPIDNIVLDWQYWEVDKWGSHEFDPARFPDPRGMIEELHQELNTRIMVSVWPKFYRGTKNFEEMQKITEDFFKTLKIPYRVVELCSGDLGDKFSRQYDIEAWFPRQKAYKEITSAGNCTDFQARALNIKYLDKGERKHVHVLNNTMIATSRAMVAILENHQQKDGSITIPKPLQKYMNRKKVIGKTKK